MQMLEKMAAPQWQDQWDELLPDALLAHCAHTSSSTGMSPFFLLYGREACLPSKRTFKAFKCDPTDEEIEHLQWRQMEHVQDLAHFQQEANQRATIWMEQEAVMCDENYHDRDLGIGDLVKQMHAAGMKLHPKWDSPFIIHDVTDKNTYQLKTRMATYSKAAQLQQYFPSNSPKACGLQAHILKRKMLQKSKSNKGKSNSHRGFPG